MTPPPLISFSSLDVKVPPFNEKSIKAWIARIAACYEKEIGEISYYFCSDKKITELNTNYFSLNYPTDIITINQVTGKILSAEIFIGLETVQKNTYLFSTDFLDELHRILIHGILHLIGFNDSSQAEKKQMKKAETKALRLLIEYFFKKIV